MELPAPVTPEITGSDLSLFNIGGEYQNTSGLSNYDVERTSLKSSIIDVDFSLSHAKW